MFRSFGPKNPWYALRKQKQGRLAQWSGGDPMSVFEMRLKHDRNGRIVERTETVAGRTNVWRYAYDKAGRLFEAHRENRLICQCWYDREGRRQRDYFPATVGSSHRDYRYTLDNRLMSAGNNGYTHDKNGSRSIWSNGSAYHLYEYAPD
ncbi:hypothetical protein [Pseudodesulfovibrio piezophilus]|nr:hypothetical protein [Pseudodesulfovibrio piezophilus]